MLSRLLRQILFTWVHFIVSLLVAVQNVYHRLWDKKGLSSDLVSRNDVQMILEYVPKMSKKLKHLVFLADTDYHSMSDLARMVIWSLIAGVPYVSLYDVTGKLKENEEKFFYEVERNKKGIPGCIKWSNKPDLNGYSNGSQAHTVVINIFTCNDGRLKITQCIKDMARGTLPYKRHSKELTAQELDEVLNLLYPAIPEPELVLYTGPLCCTHGLMPWQIRLTEFVPLSLDHSVNIEGYLGALYKYSKCDQRFGK